MANPYSAYLESQVLLASPLELVHLAYQGAVDALGEARDHLAGQRLVPQIQAVTRAQQILIQLQASLDFANGGELSQTLGKLYDYMLRRLNDGNREKSAAAFAEVQQLLQTVGEAWKQIATGQTTSTELAAAATVSSASPWTNEASSPWANDASSPWMTNAEPAVYTRAGYSL